MERIKNEIKVSGVLVKNNLKLNTNNSGVRYINGDLVLRTSDGGEHIINVFCDEITSKMENGTRTYTGNENPAFKGLETVLAYQGLDQNPNGNLILTVNSGTYTINDYINKDNELKSIYKMSANYFSSNTNKVDTNNLTCEISLNGIIQEIKEEIQNDIATGNYIIDFLVINTKGGWKKGSTDAEVDSCFPVEFLLPKKLVEGFQQCGYYIGCYTNLIANVINIQKSEEKTIKMAFGNDKIEKINTFKRYNEIVCGQAPQNPIEIGLDQDIIDALLSKRKARLDEIKKVGYLGNKNNNVAKSTNNLEQKTNPFANANKSQGFGKSNAFNPFLTTK